MLVFWYQQRGEGRPENKLELPNPPNLIRRGIIVNQSLNYFEPLLLLAMEVVTILLSTDR